VAEHAVLEVDPQPASFPKPNRGSVLSAAPRRVLKQSWTKNLFARIKPIVTKNASTAKAKRSSWWAVRRILARAESELTDERQITLAWLAGFPPQSRDVQHERQARALLGRILAGLGLWSQEDYKLFRKSLAASATRWNSSAPVIARPKKPEPSPPDELCKLVRHLAYSCGLSTGQMQKLRVTDIRIDGIQISPVRKSGNHSHLVPFGDDRDEIPKTILEAYVRKEKPTDYLFYCRSPRDKEKPLSRQTLTAAVSTLHSGDTIESLRDRHFDEDFNRARSPHEARFHFRTVHGLSNSRVHTMIIGQPANRHQPATKGFVKEAEIIPLPAPYLLAAMCASRSVSEERAKSTIPEGGKHHLITWYNLFGYEITVDWARRFAAELGGRGQKSGRALRLLYRLAFNLWFEGRRMKLHDIEDSAIRAEDRDLRDRFARTTVTVRDLANGQASWSGCLFEYGTRKSSFRVPLIEDMNRRAWHNQCQVCWHPERESIEREISEAATKETRVKGYNLIARQYGVSPISLARHCGRVAPPKKPR
jgi:hypothetical protein